MTEEKARQFSGRNSGQAVRCFDNIKLEKSGEYFIRGFIENGENIGFF